METLIGTSGNTVPAVVIVRQVVWNETFTENFENRSERKSQTIPSIQFVLVPRRSWSPNTFEKKT